jgi:hypothetical protein
MRSNDLLPPSFWQAVCKLFTAEVWSSISDAGAAQMVEQCSWHGLLSLLFAAHEVPPAIERAREAAKGWERILQVRAQLLRETVGTICDSLVDEPVVFYKGADYAQRLYPAPSLRPMQDIDILVPAARIEAVTERLLAAGFTRRLAFGATRDPAYYERVFFFRGRMVEVHPAFIQRPRHRIDYDAIWRRVVPTEAEGRRVLRLEDVDALACHALSMSVDQFHLRLIRYVDLWLLVRNRPGIVLAAARRAREWRTARGFYGALSLACRIVPEFGTEEVRDAMAAAVSAPTSRFLERWVLPRTVEMRRQQLPRRSVQLWRKAMLMDTSRNALSFALSHAANSLRYRRAP